MPKEEAGQFSPFDPTVVLIPSSGGGGGAINPARSIKLLF